MPNADASDLWSLVVLMVGAPLLYYFIQGMGQALHWYAHKSASRIGKPVTWRRKTDNVIMVGWKCHICGKITCIEPAKTSYRHMMRGDKFY